MHNLHLKIIYGLSFIIFIFSSCSSNMVKNRVVNVKYREKSPVEIIKISSVNGNIDIIGWSKDFVEINTEKLLISGFLQDLNLLDTLFEKEDNTLNIKTKIPARIEGKINLKIYVPFILLKIYIDSKSGNIGINKYLGDVELTNKNGNINIIFEGSILRIDSYKSRINLYIKSYNSTDVVVNNEDGLTDINVETIGKSSYLDVKSFESDINIAIFKDIDHKLMLTNKNGTIDVKYNIFEKNTIEGTHNSISGKKGNGYNNLTIDVSNENGKINLMLANERYLKKELNEMPLF
ncbi:MAG: hypothetical protein A2086_10010 [Spirochaetes bacterium GWD1_27_9]|nr:MAG: hypothetical protein A2Z98_13890 [Spirochaetes bacterium GWB1_27_13]OHD22892.1 MAG: hypothetical protein A2Y34_16535 [Spirochaetes bacterium GWC1_27_15]OHD42264.1 MAG: hypothetical protein A2086_10010 [Spirochaetes bacterium GWD1_27_9]